MTADAVIYLSPTEVQVNFTFDDAPLGTYSVVYSSAAFTDTLENAFTIEPATAYEFETVVEGQPNVLINTWRTYEIGVKNLSNQTAFSLPVYVKINGQTEVEITSSVLTDNLPADFAASDAHFFKVYDENAMDSVWFGAFTVLALSAGSTEYIHLNVKSLAAAPFSIQTYVGQPLYTAEAMIEAAASAVCDLQSPCLNCLLTDLGIPAPSGCETAALGLPCVIINHLDGQTTNNTVNWATQLAAVQTCTAPVAAVSTWLSTTAQALSNTLAITDATPNCHACANTPQPPFVVNTVEL